MGFELKISGLEVLSSNHYTKAAPQYMFIYICVYIYIYIYIYIYMLKIKSTMQLLYQRCINCVVSIALVLEHNELIDTSKLNKI
jgi:hypothetical protein